MTGPTTATRLLVAARDDLTCQWCGTPVRAGAFSLQHRCPRGMGGSSAPWVNGAANLVVLHGSGTTGCHGEVEAKRDRATRLGFLIRRGDRVAADVPIYVPDPLLGGFQWVLLDDDGNRRPLAEDAAAAVMRRLGIWPQEATADAGR